MSFPGAAGEFFRRSGQARQLPSLRAAWVCKAFPTNPFGDWSESSIPIGLPHAQRPAPGIAPQQAVASGARHREDVQAMIEGLDEDFQLPVAIQIRHGWGGGRAIAIAHKLQDKSPRGLVGKVLQTQAAVKEGSCRA